MIVMLRVQTSLCRKSEQGYVVDLTGDIHHRILLDLEPSLDILKKVLSIDSNTEENNQQRAVINLSIFATKPNNKNNKLTIPNKMTYTYNLLAKILLFVISTKLFQSLLSLLRHCKQKDCARPAITIRNYSYRI